MSPRGLFGSLQTYVDGVVQKHCIPALSVAVWHNNAMYVAASGMLNVDTGVEATVDSIFQIGSIGKVFTASLIMMLIDQSKVDLDTPVRHYLRNFHVADPVATAKITVRHLLSHTSGLVSDSSLGQDPYEEGNAIERYVDRCFLLPQVHNQFGDRFSYSNAAYVIAGRLVEVVSGMPWRRAVEEWIFEPLEMKLAIAAPGEALRHRAAIGHLLSGGADNRTVTVAPTCYLPLGMAPTGSVLTMSASDLLRFGRAHMNDGRPASIGRWLSESSIKLMQEEHITMPAAEMLLESKWGLGWALGECKGVKAFGHGGGTVGQHALLHILPECGSAYSVLLNGIHIAGGAPVLQQVMADLLFETAGVRPDKPSAGGQARDLKKFTGRYGETGFRFEITEKSGNLCARIEIDELTALPPQVLILSPAGENKFCASSEDGAPMYDFVFLDLAADGVPKYLFYGYRLHRRMSV